MRRQLVGFLATTLLLTGCGGDEQPPQPGPFQFPTVSNVALGTDPKIVSSTRPPTDSTLKVLVDGTGRPIESGDVVVVDYKGQPWETGGAILPTFDNTFASGMPLVQPIDSSIFKSWTKKLPGTTVGSRVLLIATPQDAFGLKPPPDSQILPNDTLMFVIDVLDAFPRDTGPSGSAVKPPAGEELPTVTGMKDPKITVPDGDPPSNLVQEVLVQGKGAKVTKDSWVAVQYTAVVWGDGKTFDSTWQRKDGPRPLLSRMAPAGELNGKPVGGMIEGLIKGLTDRQVGSRMLLVIPPSLGYGEALPAAAKEKGVTAQDTLVFVIDILGVYRSGVLPAA